VRAGEITDGKTLVTILYGARFLLGGRGRDPAEPPTG